MKATTARSLPKSGMLIGIGCLTVTAFGWGINWPMTKLLLTECPPLMARGIAGMVAGGVLATFAVARRESLAVPAQGRLRLVRAALLNVSAWMGLTTLSLTWLPAGEAAILAYTMPMWTALFARPILGERLGPARVMALAAGLCGVAILVGANGLSLSAAEFPGVGIALSAAVLFGLGTVLSKREPIAMPGLALTAWQVGIGCLPLLLASIFLERADLLRMSWFGWIALLYTATMSMGVCYVTWFAALRRLKAGTAALGTLLTPIIGVVSSSLTIGEPLRSPQVASLALIVGGIVLATRQDIRSRDVKSELVSTLFKTGSL